MAYQAVARDRDYQRLLARGDRALIEDQTFGAIEAYSGAVALRPDSMLARLRRGETYQRRGDLDAAAHDFRGGDRPRRHRGRPLEGLGNVLYQMQRYRLAAEAYEAALALDDRSLASTTSWRSRAIAPATSTPPSRAAHGPLLRTR